MKILHITNNYPTRNLPVYGIFVKEQIDSLKRIGVHVNLIFINGREEGRLEYLKAVLKIKKEVRTNCYDIVHCHHALSAITAILGGAHRKSKLIVSYQNDPANELGNIAFRIIYSKADAVIFKNRSKYLTFKNTYYFSNGVDTDFFRPMEKKEAKKKLGLEENKKYVLFISSNLIRKQKRYDIYCKTMKILSSIDKSYTKLVLTNSERSEVPFYINSSDVMLLTSDFEGSPNSVKECMSCNVPVAATNVGNVEEYFKNTKGYFVSESNNPSRLSELVLEASKIRRPSGRQRIIDLELDIQTTAKKLKQIYIQITN